MAEISGGPGNDTLNGTFDNDTIVGREGNDLLRGFLGNDLILGHEGDDLVVGGPGSDSLFGAYIINDSEFPDIGFDILSYRDCFFAVEIDLEARTASGGDAEGDTFAGFEGVEGSQDNDTLKGDTKANRLIGWDGDDILMGRGSADSLLGGDGNDTLVGGTGADLHDGGAGNDYAWYLDSTAGVTADLLAPASNTGDAAGDTFNSIEGLIGSGFGDTLRGDNLANTISGGFFDGANVCFSAGAATTPSTAVVATTGSTAEREPTGSKAALGTIRFTSTRPGTRRSNPWDRATTSPLRR